jgi:hypothetical protein
LNVRDTMRVLKSGTVWVGLALGLSGCHHQVSTWVPPQMQPVALLDVPGDDKTELTPPPVEDLPEVPVASAAEGMKSPVKRRPKAPAVAANPASAAPGATADAAPEMDDPVGSLTTEEESTPQMRQEAVDLIASTNRRLKELPSTVLVSHRTQIGKIHNFQRQAQRALDSGDAQGANTLATKGKLLLDDLLK